MRDCAHENTHGIARKSSIRWEGLRDEGREPMFNCEISLMGVAARKKSVKPSVSYTNFRYAKKLNCDISLIAVSNSAQSAVSPTSFATASMDAATSVSKLRKPISGSAYFAPMTSPCSVKRILPVIQPAGCAKMASYDGPPPRPTEPPRPWKNDTSTFA